MIPYVKGRVTLQAHVGVPEGTFEEEYARNGFSGRYAHLYRTEPPVGWKSIEGPLRPRAFDTRPKADEPMGDFLDNRIPWLYNDDVCISTDRFSRPMAYAFRNADADEVHFVHEGTGELDTDFGKLTYEPGDYLVLPRGTSFRFSPSRPTSLLIVECFSEVRLPEKGMLGQHALFDPAMLRVPTPEAKPKKEGDYELRVLRNREITRVVYPFDPLNTVGWKGTLCVWQINVRDIRPVSSDRYHLPPSAHTTFLANHVVICSFLPRPLENGDPNAMKVPFYHSNIDFDEVLFYHSGNFFSREGIAPGMITFHPQGIHHGPQPGAVERTKNVQSTEEVAVMVDTRRPLKPTEFAESKEWRDYWKSWNAKR